MHSQDRMEQQDGAGGASADEGAGPQPSSSEGWLSEMASAFLSSGDASDPVTSGEDVPQQAQVAQTQPGSNPDPGAALQALPGALAPAPGPVPAWLSAQIDQAYLANLALMQPRLQPQQLPTPLHAGLQPSVGAAGTIQAVSQTPHAEPAPELQAPPDPPSAAAAPAAPPSTMQPPSSSGSERADGSGDQMHMSPSAHAAGSASGRLRGRAKQGQPTPQKRWRDRQRGRLIAAEATVAQLTRQLQQLKMVKDQENPDDHHTPDTRWMDDDTRTFMFKSMQLEGTTVLTVDPAHQEHMTCRQLADLPPPRIGQLWWQYMTAFKGCLEQWQGNPESTAGRRLSRLFFEALQMWTAVQVGYPDRVKDVQRHMYLADPAARTRPPPKPRGPAPDDDDARLATAAGFSPQQRSVICALRVPHFVNTGRLKARRAALAAQLQVSEPLAQGMAKFEGIMKAYKATLRDEHCIYSKTGTMMWRQIYTFAQSAMLNIAAHPMPVRIWHIADLIAQQAGERTEAQLLDLGAQDPDAELLSLDVLPSSMRELRVPPPDAGLDD